MSAIEHLLIFTQRYELGKRCLKTLQPLYKVSKQTKTVLAQRPNHRLSSISPNLKGFFQQDVAFSTSALQSGASTNPCCRRIERFISRKGYSGTPRKRKRTFDPAQPLMTRTATILPCPPSPAPHSEIADHDLFPQRDRRVCSRT